MMLKKIKLWSWCLLASSIAAVFAGLGFVFGWQAIYDGLKHPAVVAWVQTIGVFVGLGVAIYVPWRQREHALVDARKNAMTLAGYVLTTVKTASTSRSWVTSEKTDGIALHLKVASRLWQTVKLDSLPHASIPSFVALIALTDEAIAWTETVKQQPSFTHKNEQGWDELAERTGKYVGNILV